MILIIFFGLCLAVITISFIGCLVYLMVMAAIYAYRKSKNKVAQKAFDDVQKALNGTAERNNHGLGKISKTENPCEILPLISGRDADLNTLIQLGLKQGDVKQLADLLDIKDDDTSVLFTSQQKMNQTCLNAVPNTYLKRDYAKDWYVPIDYNLVLSRLDDLRHASRLYQFKTDEQLNLYSNLLLVWNIDLSLIRINLAFNDDVGQNVLAKLMQTTGYQNYCSLIASFIDNPKTAPDILNDPANNKIITRFISDLMDILTSLLHVTKVHSDKVVSYLEANNKVELLPAQIALAYQKKLRESSDQLGN